jgi:ClpA/ClpB-like protein
VFERFTERARHVVALAQDEARALNHNYIGTEHFLLGLLREEEGVAARVLGSLGITLEGVRTRVARIVGQGDQPVTGQIPFTKHAMNVTNHTQREALSLGHNYIGTEHILLALVRENESVAARILLDFPADAERIREEIIRIVGPVPRQTDEAFPSETASAPDLRLRQVVPVAQQLSDGTWIVSVEIWNNWLVLRWATPEPRHRSDHPGHREQMAWLVADDVGTSYTRYAGGGGGTPDEGFHYDAHFKPAPPPEATLLLVRREPTGEELPISLAD